MTIEEYAKRLGRLHSDYIDAWEKHTADYAQKCRISHQLFIDARKALNEEFQNTSVSVVARQSISTDE